MAKKRQIPNKKNEIEKKAETRNKTNEFWKIFIGFLGVIGLVLGVLTDGFQVWDMFSKDKSEIHIPIIDFRIEPYKYKIGDENFDYKNGSVGFSIQSSNGVYKILDSIKIVELKILEKDFFYNAEYSKIDIKLKEIVIDRRILDNKISDQVGVIKFENDFVLDGKSMSELIANPREEIIAKFIIEIPYLFEKKIYKHKSEVPIIIYYE